MNCERFKSELGQAPRVPTSRAGAGAIAPDHAEHALRCAECARWLDEQRRVDGLLDLLPSIEPSQGFAGRTVARALAAERPWSRLLHSRGLRAAAAVLVLASAGAVWWTTHRSSPTDASTEPSPELLAEMDLLLDWDVLNQKGEALDAAADVDVAVAVAEFDLIEDGG